MTGSDRALPGRSRPTSVAALGLIVLGCGSGSPGGGGPPQLSVTESTTFATTPNNRVDILFMLVNGSSTTEIKQKLYDEIPAFVNVLQKQPNPLDLHVAIVTPDMGAPSDATTSIGCTAVGEDGSFRSAPTGTCTSTGLASGASFLSIGNGVANFTGDLATTLQCLALVGDNGCGFSHPLAAVARALGADGTPPPATNVGFLRDDAYLAIVLLEDQDDCSAPSNTQLYSLQVGGSNEQNLANALGPVSRYRCNRYGHLCKDASGQTVMPPLVPPSGATTLDLTDCESNDTSSGLLTPVSQFINDIKSLKPDPDNQIRVSAIVAPTTPYTVGWFPASGQGGQNLQPGELWPEILGSCGTIGSANVSPDVTQNTTDGSAGVPPVRIAEFAAAFRDSTLASLCDPSYASSMQAIATKIAALPSPPCLTGAIQLTADGLPDCSVTAHSFDQNGVFSDKALQSCELTNNVAPCWNYASGDATCSGITFSFVGTTPSTNVTVTCALCVPGVSAPGC